MPPRKTSGVQVKKRGRHRAKRKKQAAIEPKRLAEDAPLGTYLIDDVAIEIFLSGGAPGATGNEFVSLVRHEIWLVAQFAQMSAANQFVREPQRRRKTKRFFDDLSVIRSRIERNKKDLHRVDLVLSTAPRYPRPPLKQKLEGDEIDGLLAVLQDASERIEDYLERHKLDVRGGNYDYRTRTFIEDVFDLWCDWYSGEASREESRLFIRLLSAAWRDVGFPADEEDGRCLEDWFADRVRKRFDAGISSARISRQELWSLVPEKPLKPPRPPNTLKPPRPPRPN